MICLAYYGASLSRLRPNSTASPVSGPTSSILGRDLGCSGVVNTFIAIAQALQGAMKSTMARLKGLLAIGNLQHLSFSHASLHSHWGDGSGSGDKHFFLAFVSLRTSALLLERAGRIVSYFQKSMFVVISLLCLVHPG